MNSKNFFPGPVVIIFFAFGLISCLLKLIQAHCDTLDGPVVLTAMKALEKGDVTLRSQVGEKRA